MRETIYNILASQSVGTLTLQDVIINLIAALILGILIFTSYRVTHAGTIYSSKFNISLIMMTLVTTMVMCVIGNNISLSLGMVGALSIVRFRTAIKDPRDTVYIFWAIAVGICCGVSDYMIALLGTMVIFLFLVLFGHARNNNRMLIIVRGSEDALHTCQYRIDEYFSRKAILRLHNCERGADGESIFEIPSDFFEKCQKKKGSVSEMFTDIEGFKSFSIMCQEDDISN